MKNELVNEKTGKAANKNSIDENLIQKSEYEKRQHPEAPKKKAFSEKVDEFMEQTAQGMRNRNMEAEDRREARLAKERGYSEHR
jgi:hypothetical protein